MKLRDGIAPVLVALLATAGASACASSHTGAAPERAEQAEQDRLRADNDARKAEVNAAQARQDARDADRAQWEAEQRAQFAAAEASQAERDAAQIQATAPAPQPVGVTAAQAPPPAPAAAPYPRIAFDETGADLSSTERARLDDMAASLVAHPGRHAVIRAYVVDAGDEDRDVHLAQRRADTVARYLEDHGVTSDRIVTKVFSRDVAYVGGDRRGPYRSVEVVIH
jgi:outer membrane protein OmpA-like peptidoglycan-associated protein